MSVGPEKMREIHAHIDAGEPLRAIEKLRVLLRRDPTSATWHGMMARASTAAGLLEQAVLHARRCTELAPAHPTPWAELGEALHRLGRLPDAESAFARGVEISPASIIATLGLVDVLTERGRPGEAEKVLLRALQAVPDSEALLGKHASTLGALTRMKDALAAAESALVRFPGSWELAHIACLTSNYVISDPHRLFAIHSRFGKIFESRGLPPAPPPQRPDPERPLRIGLISPDFRSHSVSHFIEPLLRNVDRRECEFTLFFVGPPDDVTRRLQQCGHPLLELLGKPRSVIFDAIRKSNVDMLIDLSGHTRGGDSALLRSRPAPLLGNYCGYPNTLGMKCVDFRLVDEVTDPTGEADQFSVEKLFRIEGCFLCFVPRPETLDIPNSRIAHEPPTFGSFNAARKISDEFLDLCASLAAASPQSRFLFKSLDFKDNACAGHIRDRAVKAGISPARLVIEGPSKTTRDHLSRYGAIDIALDTFPYSGTTTTCEALFMGVPVITLAGKTHPSRVSASLLRAAGLEGCVASNPAEFVSLAAKWMADEALLRSTRESLRARLLKSDLCNGPLFARRFLAALRQVWRSKLSEEKRNG